MGLLEEKDWVLTYDVAVQVQQHMGLLEEKDRVLTYDVAVHVYVKLLVDDQPHAQLDNVKNFLRYPCQEA